jgi:hypothetical protein
MDAEAAKVILSTRSSARRKLLEAETEYGIIGETLTWQLTPTASSTTSEAKLEALTIQYQRLANKMEAEGLRLLIPEKIKEPGNYKIRDFPSMEGQVCHGKLFASQPRLHMLIYMPNRLSKN